MFIPSTRLGLIPRRSLLFASSEGPRKESAVGKSGKELCGRAPLRHLSGRALLLLASSHDKAVQGFAYFTGNMFGKITSVHFFLACASFQSTHAGGY